MGWPNAWLPGPGFLVFNGHPVITDKMKSYAAIHKFELRQTKKIARALLETRKSRFNWRIIVLPLFLYDIVRDHRRLQVLHKNFFFTKKFALEAGKHIYEGKERSWEIRLIEVKTRETLDKEKKGFYTDEIRSKQLKEIKFLLDHYLELLNLNQPDYEKAIRMNFASKGSYLAFLNQLQKIEEEVIQAAIATMRKGTKKERRLWFDKVRAATKRVRMEAADKIYSNSGT